MSWWEPGEDYRPLNDPPNEAVLGWWCSGVRYESDSSDWKDKESSLCAVVAATSEKMAWIAIQGDWPTMGEQRFIYEKPADFMPGDRFPLSDWMRPRMIKRVFFVSRVSVELYAPQPFEVEAESQDEAEDMAVEHVRTQGEVMRLSVAVEELDEGPGRNR